MNLYIQLFLSFMKVGGFTFGGGYAMLPMLKKEIVEKRKWCDETDILDYYSIGQCTPGAIAVNTATFIGCKVNGTLGGIIATLGVITPSFFIISIIALFLNNFMDSIWLSHALSGIRICVCALIFDAVFSLSKQALNDKFSIFVFILVLVCALLLPFSSIVYIIFAALLGLIYSFLANHFSRKDTK